MERAAVSRWACDKEKRARINYSLERGCSTMYQITTNSLKICHYPAVAMQGWVWGCWVHVHNRARWVMPFKEKWQEECTGTQDEQSCHFCLNERHFMAWDLQFCLQRVFVGWQHRSRALPVRLWCCFGGMGMWRIRNESDLGSTCFLLDTAPFWISPIFSL